MNLITVFSFFLQACSGSEPTRNDIIGVWKSSDGGVFVFNDDGTFTEKYFPAGFVLLPKNEYADVRFDGSGNWLLRRGNSNWEIYIDFQHVSDKRCSTAFPLLIAGANGILDNKPPWYLFVWKEEEGGDRYKFNKSN